MTQRDETMLQKGFAPAPRVAEVCQVHLQTVYRWLADDPELGVTVGGHRYLNVTALLKRFTAEECKLLGITREALLGPKPTARARA